MLVQRTSQTVLVRVLWNFKTYSHAIDFVKTGAGGKIRTCEDTKSQGVFERERRKLRSFMSAHLNPAPLTGLGYPRMIETYSPAYLSISPRAGIEA